MLRVLAIPPPSPSPRPLPSLAMLSARVPLATITDQQQLRVSPLKRLHLSEKENTVSAADLRRGTQLAGRVWVPGPGRVEGSHRRSRTPVSLQPPSLSGTRILASKAARRILLDPAEPVSDPREAQVSGWSMELPAGGGTSAAVGAKVALSQLSASASPRSRQNVSLGCPTWVSS